MGWQLTTALARAGRALGLRRRWSGERALGLTQRRSKGRADVFNRAHARALAALSEDDRFAASKAMVDLDPSARGPVERVLATGVPAAVVIEFAHAWESLGATEKSLATDPVGRSTPGPVAWGATEACQVDSTTCGAAAMAMMLMIGDPLVGVWVASGRVIHNHRPPEVERMANAATLTSIESRWGALQRSIHASTTRRGLGFLPWPRSLGTPPWRVNNQTRFLGLGFRGAVVDDTDREDLSALLSHATAAINDGIPVPVYASGDSGRGLDSVIPRHVVLLTHRMEDGFLAYEPGNAALHAVSDQQLRDGGAALRALGNWSHVSWMILPRGRRRPAQGLALEA